MRMSNLLKFETVNSEEGIGFSFNDDGGFWAVTGDETGLGRQGEHLGADAVNQGSVTAARQVSAPNAASKDEVADQSGAQAGKVKQDMPGRMAGDMPDLDFFGANR